MRGQKRVLKIDRKFGFVGGFDVPIFSAEVGLAKPDPRIYQLVLDCLQLQPNDAVFIDDNLPNIDEAHALGMHGTAFCFNPRSRCSRS